MAELATDDVALTIAVCTQLAAATPWVYRGDGSAYQAGELPIFYGALQATPDQAVAVAAYDGTDDVVNGLAVRWVQLRFRGSPGDRTGADALASTAFAALQGLARVAGLSLVTRTVVAQLGADENDRQERADSYQIILDNPEATP